MVFTVTLLITDNVIQKIRELFNISSTAECRLWMNDDGNYHILNNTDITLHDVGVESKQVNG